LFFRVSNPRLLGVVNLFNKGLRSFYFILFYLFVDHGTDRRCVFSVDEMRPINVVCPSLIKKWFKILCVCVRWMLQVPKLEERILESLFESPRAVCCITNLSYYYVLSTSHHTVVRKLLYLLWWISFKKQSCKKISKLLVICFLMKNK